MYDIIIIGAGPAGLTAAIYGKRANKKVLLLESNTYGGQIIYTNNIANYPAEENISGFDWATKLYNQVKSLKAEIKYEKALSVNINQNNKEVITNKNKYLTKTIIIATGASNRKLNLTNEEKFIGKGLSYCATCDGAFYKDRDVAVVGGGNTAVEEAIYLASIASKVYLIHRSNDFRADDILTNELKKQKNVEIIYNSNITKLNGTNYLDSIELTSSDGINKKIAISGLFIAIGRDPESENFKDLINTNQNGYFIANEDCHTNIDGIYVSGDCRTKEIRQLVTATSDGAVAATEAIKYINNN